MYNGDSTGRETDAVLEKGAYTGTGNSEYDGQDIVTGERSIVRIREGMPPVVGAEKGVPRGVVILVVVFLDLFAVGMAMPLVTPLIKELGASPLQVGFLSSTYGAVQLVTGPFFGLLSDSMGRRVVILVAYAGAGASYLLLGQSTTVTMVVISRVLLGITKHSMNAVKAYVADHTTATNRAVELGRMATASALGIMVGPAVGGMLFKAGSYPLPTAAAALLYAINSFVIVTRLEAQKISANSAPLHASKRTRLFSLQGLLPNVAILTRPRVAALMAVRAVLGLAVHLFRQGFSLLLIYRLNLPVHTNGLLLSLQGLLTSLVQGLAIRPLLRRFPETPLIFRGLLLLSLTLALLAAAPSLLFLILLLPPLALSTGVLRTTYTALLTTSVAQSEVGQLLGLSDAIMSACRVLGPSAAGLLSSQFGYHAPVAVSSIAAATAAHLGLTLVPVRTSHFALCFPSPHLLPGSAVIAATAALLFHMRVLHHHQPASAANPLHLPHLCSTSLSLPSLHLLPGSAVIAATAALLFRLLVQRILSTLPPLSLPPSVHVLPATAIIAAIAALLFHLLVLRRHQPASAANPLHLPHLCSTSLSLSSPHLLPGSAVIAATAALLFHLLVLRRHQPASAAGMGILSKGHLA
ncbi:unnamed protein product [Closterium sp. Naga37s-1]|nr:unnamed protein product [Closterium sp. Naga37s-1]